MGDLDPILKVITLLSYIKTKNELCLHSIFNQRVDFDQTWTETTLGQGEEVFRFWWPSPHFQGHTSTLNFKLWHKKKLNCTLSLEPNDGFRLSFMCCIIGINEILETLTQFSRSPHYQDLKWTFSAVQWVDFDQTCTETAYHQGNISEQKWPHHSCTSTVKCRWVWCG